MALFVKHHPCPSCGSRDNLGEYSDGSYFCFGCHYYSPPTRPGHTRTGGSSTKGASLPTNDGGYDLSPLCLQLLQVRGISPEVAIRNGIFYHKPRDQLCIPFKDAEGTTCFVQARNLHPKSKTKYYNYGDKSEHWQFYGMSDTVVLTEDAFSAIRVGEVFCGYPILGTSIQKERLVRLSERFERVFVWLDSDKWDASRRISEQLQLLGVDSRSLFTKEDPNRLTKDEIVRTITT